MCVAHVRDIVGIVCGDRYVSFGVWRVVCDEVCRKAVEFLDRGECDGSDIFADVLAEVLAYFDNFFA